METSISQLVSFTIRFYTNDCLNPDGGTDSGSRLGSIFVDNFCSRLIKLF